MVVCIFQATSNYTIAVTEKTEGRVFPGCGFVTEYKNVSEGHMDGDCMKKSNFSDWEKKSAP